MLKLDDEVTYSTQEERMEWKYSFKTLTIIVNFNNNVRGNVITG